MALIRLIQHVLVLKRRNFMIAALTDAVSIFLGIFPIDRHIIMVVSPASLYKLTGIFQIPLYIN